VKFLKAFGKFWYEFIIGDDWKIAAAVVIAIALLTWATVGKWFSNDDWLAVLGAAFIVVAFAISLAVDVRPRRKS
jgi:hypothetical protein